MTRTDLDAVLRALQRRFPTGQHYTAEDVSKWGLVTAPGGVLRKLDNPSLCRPLLETLHDQKQVTRRANGYRAGQGITWPPSKIMDPKTLDACACLVRAEGFFTLTSPEGYTAQEVSEAGLVTDDGAGSWTIRTSATRSWRVCTGVGRSVPIWGVLKQNGRYSRAAAPLARWGPPPGAGTGGGPCLSPGGALDDGSHPHCPAPPKGALELAR